MYDAAGQWATEVGIPAKSGVSGGIVCVLPEYYGFATYAPGPRRPRELGARRRALPDLSETFGLHLFADPAESVFGRIAQPGRSA